MIPLLRSDVAAVVDEMDAERIAAPDKGVALVLGYAIGKLESLIAPESHHYRDLIDSAWFVDLYEQEFAERQGELMRDPDEPTDNEDHAWILAANEVAEKAYEDGDVVWSSDGDWLVQG